MKKFKLLLFITLIATLIAGLSACNCNGSDSDGVKTYTVTPDTSKSLTLNVGDSDVDFTQYFILKDSDGNEIPVTADMLDLSYVDTSKTGGFMVYLNYNGSSGALWFTVVTDNSDNQMMEKQTYDAATFDNRNLQDILSQYTESGDTAGEGNAIGLPSTGTYNALVIPVQFSGDTITQTQLDKLNKAFNGTSADTGWESVKTYYQKASYGKLNITFDVQPVCRMQYSSSYYENLTATDEQSGQDYKNGDNVILHEALTKLDSAIDFSKYDTNNDGCIDAVYLIYSAPVDYKNADFFWAYVTWNGTDNQYDNKYAYYYMFTGLDFMDEGSANNGSMTINTETFIHETGHLLALDDYYDYDSNAGCNEGLGGCAMMDWNIGDHDAYSKIMMGWTDATVVNETQTITIKSLQEKGDVILIPLNFDNTYFCEYLLIDLYSAQGLNELRSEHGSTVLYGGAEYGVRIYHISSSANNPYNNNYGSFTDCNNSDTANALIKLVEADGGDSKFTDSDGYATVATESDLWKTGSTLGSVFENYTRNNGDTVNFEISIDSVSAEQATITVTFKN